MYNKCIVYICVTICIQGLLGGGGYSEGGKSVNAV